MFVSFGIKDIIDILCVAGLLYYVYRLMKDSGSLYVFYGVLVFIAIWVAVSQVLEMRLLGTIFDKLVSVGAIAFIILFQDDIRRFLLTIGSQRKMLVWTKLLSRRGKNDKNSAEAMRKKNENVTNVVLACEQMSKNNVGALIVLQRSMSLTDIIKTGVVVDAKISVRLIRNIFFKNSPLHDGAMIISNGRIVAAECMLPSSNSIGIPKDFGTRHRAALGMAEQSDAVVIVVSEETGHITIARKGEFKGNVSTGELENIVSSAMT
ncbi:MAG: diadenylate cyclase CdaA [Prevotellaceae bacterium]|nr:diadenylate cyclase CdaA [Candidatus Colivivens caballi]